MPFKKHRPEETALVSFRDYNGDARYEVSAMLDGGHSYATNWSSVSPPLM